MPRLHLAVGCLIWLFALSRAVEDRMEAMDQVELSGYLGKQPDEAGGECATEVSRPTYLLMPVHLFFEVVVVLHCFAHFACAVRRPIPSHRVARRAAARV